MVDVAKAAGVSTALVSIVFRDAPGASDTTRARVRQVAEDLGYVPDRRAQKLRQSSSKLIGVTFELEQAFHVDIIEQLYPEAESRGYDLMLSGIAPSRDEKTAIHALTRERCEALVLLGSRLTATDLETLAKERPVQVVARTSGTNKVSSIRMDDARGIEITLDHLVKLGHTNIAYITGGDAPGAREREQTFLSAFQNITRTVVPGGATESDGAKATVEALQSAERPTAILAFNDRVALGVLDVLLRQGIRVPEDISVVGYDDSRLSRLAHINLTTVAQDAGQLAGAIIDSVLAGIASDFPEDIVLAPILVERGTSH